MTRAGIYERIQEVVRQIPPGKVATYAQIADFVDYATPRMVGYALAALRPGSEVPWHRVINSQGKISPRARGQEDARQRGLLEAEGVVLDRSGRIDLERFGWSDRE